jgi:hypothetical protein
MEERKDDIFIFVPCGSTVLGEYRQSVLYVSEPCFLTLGRTSWKGGGFSLSTGLYLHRAAQYRKTKNIHDFSGIQTHDPSIQAARTHL